MAFIACHTKPLAKRGGAAGYCTRVRLVTYYLSTSIVRFNIPVVAQEANKETTSGLWIVVTEQLHSYYPVKSYTYDVARLYMTSSWQRPALKRRLYRQLEASKMRRSFSLLQQSLQLKILITSVVDSQDNLLMSKRRKRISAPNHKQYSKNWGKRLY